MISNYGSIKDLQTKERVLNICS